MEYKAMWVFISPLQLFIIITVILIQNLFVHPDIVVKPILRVASLRPRAPK